MGVLKSIFISLILLAILAGVSGLIAREYFLYQSVTMVSNVLNELEGQGTSTGAFRAQCASRGLASGFEDITLQLRFTTSTHFVTEVVCGGSILNPIVIGEFNLPPYVLKRAGESSGVVIGAPVSSVGLSIWGASKDVVIQDSQVSVTKAKKIDNFHPGPMTVCAGIGYQCCQEEVSTGVGQVFGDVSDCASSCYSSCTPRPIVLTFQTESSSSSSSRTAQVKVGQNVVFNYVVDPGSPDGATVDLDFGDGKNQTSSKMSGTLTYIYYCPSGGGCTYTAHLSARTTSGSISSDTPLTKLTIQVQP